MNMKSPPRRRRLPAAAAVPAVRLGLLLLSSSGSNHRRFAARAASDAPSFPPPFGYQSGGGDDDPYYAADNRDSYPGGMVYDPESKLAYVAGIAYGAYFDAGDDDAAAGGSGGIEEDGGGSEGAGGGGGESDCFLAVLRLPDSNSADEGEYGSTGDGTPNAPPRTPALLRSLRVGTAATPEVCSSLVRFPLSSEGGTGASDIGEKTRLALVGHTEEGGYLTGLRDVGGKRATEYGYALEVELDLDSGSTDAEIGLDGSSAFVPGGRLFRSSKVQYPAAAAVPPSSSDDDDEVVYVASMVTDDDAVNPYYYSSDHLKSDAPDGTAGTDPKFSHVGGSTGRAYGMAGSWHRYGETFDITVTKLRRKTAEEMTKDEAQVDRVGGADYSPKETMKVLWERTFATSEGTTGDGSSHPGALLADLLYVPRRRAQSPQSADGGSRSLVVVRSSDFLLLAGSTRGFGAAFGTEVKTDGGDWDGFLTKLSPATGEELVPSNLEERLRRPHSVRIKSENGMDDVVRGVCVQPGSEDVREAYVVGSTRGIFDADGLPGGREYYYDDDGRPTTEESLVIESAFAAKVDLDGMKVLWKRQFTAQSRDRFEIDEGSFGSGCAVTADGKFVYLAGVTEDGSVLRRKDLKADVSGGGGRDDVFLVKLDADSGGVRWMRQMGTAEDEWLAKGGGVASDAGGGAILYGGTRGGLMRPRRRGDSASSSSGDGSVDEEEGPEERPALPAADVFVIGVSPDGTFPPIREGLPRADDGPGGQRPPNPDGARPGDAVDPKVPDQPVGSQGKVGTSTESGSGNGPSQILRTFLLVIAGTGVAILLLVSARRSVARRNRRALAGVSLRGAEIRQEDVTKHLRGFDEVDLAIRASATGGWHGMYDFGDERSQASAGPGRVPDEVDVTSEEGGVVARDGRNRASFTIGDDDDDDDDDGDERGTTADGRDPDAEPDAPWGAGYEGLAESYDDHTWDDDRNPPALLGGGGTGGMAGVGDGGEEEEEEENDDGPKLNEIL